MTFWQNADGLAALMSAQDADLLPTYAYSGPVRRCKKCGAVIRWDGQRWFSTAAGITLARCPARLLKGHKPR